MSEVFWQRLAEQGWFDILYPEEAGGSRLGLVDMTVLMEEMRGAVMHDLQLYFKRAKACEIAFGDATWQRERVARLVTV